MGFSFPFPKIGNVVRPIGQGCRVCVHQTYCPAVYWFRRGCDKFGERIQPIDDDHMGIACSSWSDDKASMVKTWNQKDLDEVDYIYNQHIGSEANRFGGDGFTGTYRSP